MDSPPYTKTTRSATRSIGNIQGCRVDIPPCTKTTLIATRSSGNAHFTLHRKDADRKPKQRQRRGVGWTSHPTPKRGGAQHEAAAMWGCRLDILLYTTSTLIATRSSGNAGVQGGHPTLHQNDADRNTKQRQCRGAGWTSHHQHDADRKTKQPSL